MEIKRALLLIFFCSAAAIQENQRKQKYLFENKGVNSPIYYFRMPPIPYSFIPGLGYVSTSQNRVQDMVNLPIPFLGNGRPVTIYRWSQVPLISTPDVADSNVVRMNGNYLFNGKPKSNVLLLKNEDFYQDYFNNIYP